MRWPYVNDRRRDALVADAKIVSGPLVGERGNDTPPTNPPGRQLHRFPDEWQRECWDFMDSLGEYAQGVNWKCNMLSRVRLVAARRPKADGDPEIIDSGPAAEIMAELAGGVGGQAALMSSFGTYLTVPGECYLIGETLPDGTNKWYARSIEEVLPAPSEDPGRYRLSEGNGRWRVLPADSLVVRIWRPHKRWHNVATSPSRACRPKLRELELINRHIQSQYLSRLASAGIVIFPEEVSFPTRPEFADEPDPFVAEWVEVAAEAIRTPGTAAAVIPIPIKVPAEVVDKIRHIDFTLKLDDQIIAKRASLLSGLAISMDMPPEAMLGTTGVNHWNAWLIDEQGVRIHVAPDSEIICDGLTTGYLIPRLEAAGEDTTDIIVWYDASKLILRPDLTKQATDAYDRGELRPETYRSAIGFDETDKPSDDDLRQMMLNMIVRTQPVNAMTALGKLFPELAPELPADQPADAERPDPANVPDAPVRDVNDTRTMPEKPDTKKSAAQIRRDLITAWKHQAGLPHAIRIRPDGWSLLHPADCAAHLASCPVSHATWKPTVSARPGTTGVYECWLNPLGQPIMGQRLAETDFRSMIETDPGSGIDTSVITEQPDLADFEEVLGDADLIDMIVGGDRG